LGKREQLATVSLKRPRRFFERPLPWIILFVLLAGLIFAVSYFGIRAAGDRGAVFLLLVGLGSFTLLIILFTFFYSVKKRALQERVGGSMMTWFKSHIYLGVIALLAALAHAAVYPLTPQLTTGKVTAVILALLVLSGIAWRIVYGTVPDEVAKDVGNLSLRDTNKHLTQLQLDLDRLSAGKSQPFHKAVRDLQDKRRTVVEVEKDIAALDVGEKHAWAEAKTLIAQMDVERVRGGKQYRFARFLQGWRALHWPLAAILLGFVVFHILDVFNAGAFLKSEPEQQFAASNDCAGCHASIVDEWKLSMHRNAQTSTITVAQSVFALQKYPDFGKACVNCHAPVGVKFSQKASFPLAAPDPEDDPQAVQDEGVTCVVCHTMPHPPDEMGGASDKFPIGKKSGVSLETMFGPPLEDPRPIPNSAHDVETGFMGTPQSSSQMCAACHNVKVDIEGDGIVAAEVRDLVDESNPADTDGDGVLDENELDIENGVLQDLVLQTTYDEWEDFLFANGGSGPACSDCHMPGLGEEPIVDNPPPQLAEAPRRRTTHSFVGVDYDLNISYYSKPGMPEEALKHVLEEREALLRQSAALRVSQTPPDPAGLITATVEVTGLPAHSFPTGFAFARQFWLEVSATTASGREVCLAPDPHGIPSPCSSGRITKPTANLRTCDPAAHGLGNREIKFSIAVPLDRCDPWLANFQKILTDGDADGDGIFTEVAHQSLLPDIVKLRVRTADQQVMAPLLPGRSAAFNYVFDASQAVGEEVKVKVVMRHRHLPPYFVQAMDPFFRPGIESEKLLENMTIVNIASNEPLEEPLTTPDPDSLNAKSERLAAAEEALDAPVQQAGGWGLALIAVPLSAVATLFTRRRLGRRR
jgi:hypothetical protein